MTECRSYRADAERQVLSNGTLVDMGQEIPARDEQTAEALGAYHKGEIERWWPILRAADIKVE